MRTQAKGVPGLRVALAADLADVADTGRRGAVAAVAAGAVGSLGVAVLAQSLGVHAGLVLFDDIRGQAVGRHQGRVAVAAVAGG